MLAAIRTGATLIGKRKSMLLITGLFVLYSFRQYLMPTFSDDDAFFFDVSYHLVTKHQMMADNYGSVLGADTFVAGMPILYPLLTTVDVYAVLATHNVLFSKLSCLLLLLSLMVIAVRAIQVDRPGVGYGILFLVLFTDGWISNAFSSLRYDGWLIIVMTIVYLWMRRVLAFGGWPNVLGLIAVLVCSALSHWQMATTVLAVLVNLALFGVRRRKISWAQLTSIVAVMGILYAGYAAYLLGDPVKRAALRLQLIELRAYSGQPTGIDLVKKAKVVFGSVFFSNHEHSIFSILLIVLLSVLATSLARGLFSKNGSPPTPELWSDAVFLAFGLAPVLAMDYIGARWIPLYLVVVLMLVRHVSFDAWGRGSKRLLVVLSANYVGYALMAHYLHLSWLDLLLCHASFVLTAYLVCWWSAARTVSVRSLNAFGVCLVGLNLICNFPLYSAWRGQGAPASQGAVERFEVAMSRMLPEVFGNGALDSKRIEIFCDPSVYYLPIRLLDTDNRVAVRTLFPLLYLRSDVAQAKFMGAFRPEYVLLSDDDRDQLQHDSKVGPRFLANLSRSYIKVGRVVEAGVGTDFYRRAQRDSAVPPH